MSIDFASALLADHVGVLVLSSDAGICFAFLKHEREQQNAVIFETLGEVLSDAMRSLALSYVVF